MHPAPAVETQSPPPPNSDAAYQPDSAMGADKAILLPPATSAPVTLEEAMAPEISAPLTGVHSREPVKPATSENFGEFYEKLFAPMARSLQIHMGLSPEQAADVTQEAFIKAWEKLQAGSITYFSQWLRTVAEHLAIDALRKTRGHQQVPLTTPAKRDSRTTIGDMLVEPNSGKDWGEHFGNTELLGAILRAIRPNYRKVILLRLHHGLSFNEIATLLDCKPGAAKMLFSRAIERAQFIGRQLAGPTLND